MNIGWLLQRLFCIVGLHYYKPWIEQRSWWGKTIAHRKKARRYQFAEFRGQCDCCKKYTPWMRKKHYEAWISKTSWVNERVHCYRSIR